VDGQPADIPNSPNNRIDVRDQNIVADTREHHILAKGRAEDNIGVLSFDVREHTLLQNIE